MRNGGPLYDRKRRNVFESDHRRVNGKSLLGVLSLGLKCGDTFALSASGDDEIDAVEALSAML